jgi:hypothetical protein
MNNVRRLVFKGVNAQKVVTAKRIETEQAVAQNILNPSFQSVFQVYEWKTSLQFQKLVIVMFVARSIEILAMSMAVADRVVSIVG